MGDILDDLLDGFKASIRADPALGLLLKGAAVVGGTASADDIAATLQPVLVDLVARLPSSVTDDQVRTMVRGIVELGLERRRDAAA